MMTRKEKGLARWARTLPNALKRIAFENEILAIGKGYLPSFAHDVLDGHQPSDAYWHWLADLWEKNGAPS